MLDLVVDFTTYVFVPAYAIAAGGLMPEPLAIPAGMRHRRHRRALFRRHGDEDRRQLFPRLSDAVERGGVLSVCAADCRLALAAAVVVLLAVATFLPFKFLHPMRVRRLRALNIAAVALWSVLALIAVFYDLDPGPWVSGGLVLIAVYLVGVGLTEKR